MTAGEAIALADELRPNAYSVEQKLRWLRRLDGQIFCELEETHGESLPPAGGRWPAGPDEVPAVGAGVLDGPPVGHSPVSPAEQCSALRETPQSASLTAPLAGEQTALPDAYEADTVLLAPFPWAEGLYTAWLFCQIDLHNGEIQRYNQSLQLLAAAWRSLADWMNRRRMPLGVGTWRM